MALQCQVVLSRGSTTAGQTPPVWGNLVVYNPNASPILVTGARLAVTQPTSNINAMPAAGRELPLGPGVTTLCPAFSTITIGPFALQFNNAANDNPFQMVNQTGNPNPINPQPSQMPQRQYSIGCLVYGSDGSVNSAGPSGLLVSYQSAPPPSFQGGFFNFAGPNNFVTGFLAGFF